MTTRTTARALETKLINIVRANHTTSFKYGKMTFTTIEDAKAFCKKYNLDENRIEKI